MTQRLFVALEFFNNVSNINSYSMACLGLNKLVI